MPTFLSQSISAQQKSQGDLDRHIPSGMQAQKRHLWTHARKRAKLVDGLGNIRVKVVLQPLRSLSDISSFFFSFFCWSPSIGSGGERDELCLSAPEAYFADGVRDDVLLGGQQSIEAECATQRCA